MDVDEYGNSNKIVFRAPSPEVKLNLLKEIAVEHGLDWDPTESKTELLEPHEDLLANKKMESDVGIAQTAKPDNVWIHGGLSEHVSPRRDNIVIAAITCYILAAL
ncbi:IST1-like protein [Tanacetum coccineum]